MRRSIARRVQRAMFSISLVSVLAAAAVVSMVNEDLEQSLLALDFKAERDFVLENADQQRGPLAWDTANLKAHYVPASMAGTQPLPEIFRELPFPFSGEVEIADKTFLITLSQVNGGRLYLAKDISVLEQREAMFNRILAAVSLGVIALSFGLARISSRRVVMPLLQLAGQIRATPAGRRMQRIPLDFRDLELRAIAETFNGFLDELEAFIRREQSLLSLASHELHTPIAVVSGGLEVIEQRGQLGPGDRKTLKRVQRAVGEMQANVDVVLKLARRKEHTEKAEAFSLTAMIEEVLEELRSTLGAAGRVQLTALAESPVMADPVLAKMLLRNLIQNALQHTAGGVRIRLYAGLVEITDEGPGLPEAYRELLEKSTPISDPTALPGLGLFIATLICERLGWRLELTGAASGGTTIRLHVHAPMPDAGAVVSTTRA